MSVAAVGLQSWVNIKRAIAYLIFGGGEGGVFNIRGRRLLFDSLTALTDKLEAALCVFFAKLALQKADENPEDPFDGETCLSTEENGIERWPISMMCKTGLYGKRISIWVIQGLVQGIVTMKNPFRGSMTVQTKMAQLRMILLPTIVLLISSMPGGRPWPWWSPPRGTGRALQDAGFWTPKACGDPIWSKCHRSTSGSSDDRCGTGCERRRGLCWMHGPALPFRPAAQTPTGPTRGTRVPPLSTSWVKQCGTIRPCCIRKTCGPVRLTLCAVPSHMWAF